MPASRTAPERSSRRAPARSATREALRALPQVNAVMEREEARQEAARHGRRIVTALVRERLDALRTRIRSGSLDASAVRSEAEGLLAWVASEVRARTASTIRPVINATGVVLHTNLGRAVLPDAATRRMTEVSRAYTTLEYDLAQGARGSRSSHLDRVLGLLFPGKAFHVVNNNAAAVLLALNTLAEGKEVIVSRGELVEIGGSFRIPDVMRKSGAILREVGTTNKTRLQDYERAIGPKTGLILKVHPSNYRIVGFTAHAGLEDVAALGRKKKVPVLMDQGSGNLIDLAAHGIHNEPSVHDALADGADVVCFSGDKLLGGPQAGLIIGRPDLVKPMKENSLTRALRVDKMTYAALEAVLLEYGRGTAESGL
ncbi:MAG TPA: L-seryl-tRNA(Sec) selenium transferase, partial [Candidatus Polarisedimenticolia bacterium]|nr:L-seryl-tRNA(Sec) selenium transferase [Candidatus Polarisedimenticolia bacterium]